MLLLLVATGVLILILLFLAFRGTSSKKVTSDTLKELNRDSIPELKKQLADEIGRDKELAKQLTQTNEKLKISESEIERLNSELKILTEVHNGLKEQYDELERTSLGTKEDSNSGKLKESPSIEQRLSEDIPS